MKMMIPAALAAGLALAGCGGAKADDTQFRAAFVGQCEQQIRSNPAAPAGLDIGAACRCATDSALANKSNVAAYAQTPEGQQAVAQAVATCIQQQAGNLTLQPQAADPAAAPQAADTAPAESVEPTQ